MGMIGKWIDTLSEKERDAIITHPDPTYDGRGWWSPPDNCGCLVGCVVNAARPMEPDCDEDESPGEPWRLTRGGGWSASQARTAESAGFRFPELTRRFTPERMWRLVKARAARGHRIALPAATVNVEATAAAPS